MQRLLWTTLILGFVLIGGCGKTDQDAPPQFNETLGGTPDGAPLGAGTIDTGIMNDPASYQPSRYEPLTPSTAAPEAAGSPETSEARQPIDQALDAAFVFDFESLLRSCVPEQVQSLMDSDALDSLNALSDAIRNNNTLLAQKASDPQLQQLTGLSTALPGIGTALKSAIVINVIDEQTASASIDLNRMPPELMTQLTALMQQMMALAGNAGMPAATPPAEPTQAEAAPPAAVPGRIAQRGSRTPGNPPPAEGESAGTTASEPPPAPPAGAIPMLSMDDLTAGLSQFAIPLRKVDGAWKIALPVTITQEQAELINELAVALRGMIDDSTQAIDQVETLDLQTYMQISTQTQMRHVPELLGIVGRLMPLFMQSTEAAPAAEPEQQPANEDENP